MSHSSKTKAEESVFYVYAILDPRKPGHFRYGHFKFEYEPIYIGKGNGKRSLAHISGRCH
jgi:hypothetical protein